MIVVSDKLSTESFHAFIDEQLDDEQYLQVEEQLDEIPEKVEEIQQCQIINERLREVFDPIVEEELPQDLFELALYGVISEQEESPQDFQQYGYEYDEGLNAITGYEEEITSPMDTMGSALELQDEEFLDDNEFADLEALSGQEGMADFDIDAIRNDSNNIIPDIFDNENEQAQQELAASQSQAQASSIADDDAMLDSIGSLSLEPLETEDINSGDVSGVQLQEEPSSGAAVETGDIDSSIAGIDVPELTLEPIAQTEEIQPQSEFTAPIENTEIVEQETEHLTEQQAAKEKVLETLKTSEDLSLEAQQTEQDASAIQLPADSEQVEEPENIAMPAALDQAEASDNIAIQAEEEEPDELQPAVEQEDQTRHVLGGIDLDESLASESIAPESVSEDIWSERLAESVQGTETESEPGSEQIPVTDPEEIESKPAELASESILSTPHSPEYSIDEIAEQLDEMPNGDFPNSNSSVPQDVVAEFFAENKADPDFEVSEVVKQFEEVSDEFSQHHHQDPFESPVTHIKQKADDVLNVINNKFFALKNSILKKEEEPFPDFNQAPSFTAAATPDKFAEHSKVRDVSEDNAPFDIGFEEEVIAPPSSQFEQGTDTEPGETLAPFDFEVGVDVEPKSENFTRKIGDTLRSYKEKIAEQKAADSGGSAFETGNIEISHSVVPHTEPPEGFAKYKQIAVDAIERVSPENRMTIGGVILLVIGLVIGGSSASLIELPSSVISSEKIEQLAIDAHILYTQQDQNFAGNPSTSITESMQWLSARIGRPIRLADVQLVEFNHKRAIVMPTMVSYATANIFENANNEKITLFIAGNIDGDSNLPMTCRIPTGVDGLCSWVKDSVSYVAVGNLSLSRVRDFSQAIVNKL
ncbi:hypothetical protein [Kaarinaea lacus]